MYGCCNITLANKQPETVNGSPESIIARAAKRAAKITGSWAEEIAEAVEGLSTSKQIRAALRRIEMQLDAQELESAIAEADLHAGMLGALDAHYEAETEDIVTPVQFGYPSEFVWCLAEAVPGQMGGKFASRGIDHAVAAFNRLEILRVQSLREAYEQLDELALSHAFWVSGETRKAMLKTVRRELARQIQKGADLREFQKWIKKRLESSGWTPRNRSHVETIFRTNVLRAYGAGRAVQMQHPTVLEARPFWRIVGVKDNRTRANHRAVQGWVLRADDPAWREAYPPFGFNCRERVTSRRTATNIRDGEELLKLVPDPGFRSGLTGIVGPRTSGAKAPKPKPPGLRSALQKAAAVQEPDRYVPLDKNPVRDLVGGGRLSNALVRVVEKESNVYMVSVKADELDDLMLRTYDLNAKTVKHELLVVREDLQGQKNFGLKLVKDQAEAYQRMGIKEIQLDAAWIGRYVWPSLGFRPPAATERGIVAAFRAWASARGVEIPASVDTAPKVANFKIDDRKLGRQYLLDSEDGVVEGYSATPVTVLKYLRKRGI